MTARVAFVAVWPSDPCFLQPRVAAPAAGHRADGAASGDPTLSRLLWAGAHRLPCSYTSRRRHRSWLSPGAAPTPVFHTGTPDPVPRPHGLLDWKLARLLVEPVITMVSKTTRYEFLVHFKMVSKRHNNAHVPAIFFVLMYELSISSVR